VKATVAKVVPTPSNGSAEFVKVYRARVIVNNDCAQW
jgi:hypothetical protein